MTITVICPNLKCRSLLRIPEEMRGQKVRCGLCGSNFQVPSDTSDVHNVESTSGTSTKPPDNPT